MALGFNPHALSSGASGAPVHLLLKTAPMNPLPAPLPEHSNVIKRSSLGSPWIALVALKNFWWEKRDRDAVGQQQWRYRFCPLADGIASIPRFVKALEGVGYKGFYTLHTEYKSGNSYKQLSTAECVEQTAKDFTFLKRVFSRLVR